MRSGRELWVVARLMYRTALVLLMCVGAAASRPAAASAARTSGSPEVVIRGATVAAVAETLVRRVTESGYDRRPTPQRGVLAFARSSSSVDKLLALSPSSKIYVYFRLIRLVGGVRVIAALDELHESLFLFRSRVSPDERQSRAIQGLLDDVRAALEAPAGQANSPSEADSLGAVRLITVAQPEAVTVGPVVAEDSVVWIGLRNGPRLVKLDPSSETVTAELRLENGPVSMQLLGGSIWIADTRPALVQVSPESLRILSTTPLPSVPRRFVAGSGALWFVDQKGHLLRVGQTEHEIRTCEIDGVVTDIACAGGAVWALLSNGLMRIEPATLVPGDRIKIGGWPECFAADSVSMWVLTTKATLFGVGQFLSRRSAQTGKEEQTTRLWTRPLKLWAHGGAPWRLDAEAAPTVGYRLTRLDRESQQPVEYYSLPSDGLWGDWSAAGRRLWMGTGWAGSLLRLDLGQPAVPASADE